MSSSTRPETAGDRVIKASIAFHGVIGIDALAQYKARSGFTTTSTADPMTGLAEDPDMRGGENPSQEPVAPSLSATTQNTDHLDLIESTDSHLGASNSMSLPFRTKANAGPSQPPTTPLMCTPFRTPILQSIDSTDFVADLQAEIEALEKEREDERKALATEKVWLAEERKRLMDWEAKLKEQAEALLQLSERLDVGKLDVGTRTELAEERAEDKKAIRFDDTSSLAPSEVFKTTAQQSLIQTQSSALELDKMLADLEQILSAAEYRLPVEAKFLYDCTDYPALVNHLPRLISICQQEEDILNEAIKQGANVLKKA